MVGCYPPGNPGTRVLKLMLKENFFNNRRLKEIIGTLWRILLNFGPTLYEVC